MAEKKYVPSGVWLTCDKGAIPSPLMATHSEGVSLFDKEFVLSADKEFMVNFQPMGPCVCLHGQPCMAQPLEWTSVADGVEINGVSPVLEDAKLPCALGGMMSIRMTLPAAFASVPKGAKQEKDFWDKALDFGEGFGNGVWKGLKGTAVGIYDAGVWVTKHSAPYMLMNPTGYAEQLKQDAQTFEALKQMSGQAGSWVYRNSMVNALTDFEDYKAAQQENKQVMDAVAEKMNNMDAGEWGDFAGQVAFEVGLNLATGGGSGVVTGMKAADLTGDAIRVGQKLDKALDASKAADKASDAAKAANAAKTAHQVDKASEIVVHDELKAYGPQQLGDVVNSGSDVITLKGGKKGEGWNDLLNGELKPNAKYLVDDYLYETDALGRVERVRGKLTLEERGRNTYQQVQSVKTKDGIKGDQGGHLVGDRFYGPGEQINYVPQKASLNQKLYKKMENSWQRALREGKEVEVDIQNFYEGTSKRPVGQQVNYTIKDGNEIASFEEIFVN